MRLDAVETPTVAQAVEDVAARPDAHARLASAAPPLQPIGGGTGPYRIVRHQPGSLTVSDQVTAVQVPLTQVQSVSTYDHLRGAIEGALSAGAVGFVLGFAARAFLVPRGCASDSPCDESLPIRQGVEVGAVFGLITGLIGVAVGGTMGHETRFEIAGAPRRPPKSDR